MTSFQEIHDILFREHERQYENFTRLILTLSVGFVTFTLALKQVNNPLDIGYKLAILLHSPSILFGVWLQFILVKRPLDDLQKAAKIFDELSTTKLGRSKYFHRGPPITEVISFYAQIICFIISFAVLVTMTLLS